MTAEERRLQESRERVVHWKRWGPYLSERAWGTVREDYSADGTAWEFLPHDRARFTAYRWNEDGIAGWCDRRQHICLAPAFWNGRDPFLKERLFGLSNAEGNHGEDVKEVYFHLDATPTHSYARYLYKYPHAEFPYDRLRQENAARTRDDPEFELLDAGVFDDDRYFDIFVEYAKASAEDTLIRIEAHNRGPEPAPLWILPTAWFRNTWSWGLDDRRPRLSLIDDPNGVTAIDLSHPYYIRKRRLWLDGAPSVLFTENDSNLARLHGAENPDRYVVDAFHAYIVDGDTDAVRPDPWGTRACGRYRFELAAGESCVVSLRLAVVEDDVEPPDPFGDGFDEVFADRRREADEFYAQVVPDSCDPDARRVMRQALAGTIWSQQFYHYDVSRWLKGDPAQPDPPASRRSGRNHQWTHLHNEDVISMPDPWEYPWYAAWDLAFHCVPLALVDPDFAKDQLILMLREWYMHANGQIPAYEWSFGDVNPPVHAWAAWRIYKIERRHWGRSDRVFLERVFHKLLLNFTWWVNRKDADGRNVFQGGFLGLDNIGVFDRGAELPEGLHLDQSDATSWMGMYCLNMLSIALELAQDNRAYEDIASKFFEHFVVICRAMNSIGREGLSLWDPEDRFYYDALHGDDGTGTRLKVRSMVGLIPLFSAETLEPETIDRLPGFKRRMQWFLENRPDFAMHVERRTVPEGVRRFLSLVPVGRLQDVLTRMLDEDEFLSPHGVRSLSRYHLDHPFHLEADGEAFRIGYEPAESRDPMFGGNSNWRGPVWFPVNFLLVEALQRFHHFLGDRFRVELPTGSGHEVGLDGVADDLSRRLRSLFLRNADATRPALAASSRFRDDPHWRDHLWFHEYFDGDTGAGLGACHQTGWTALVAKLLQQSAFG